MRVCFICSEAFGWGRYGGFGKLVRAIGAALLRRGVEVAAVVWRGENQQRYEHVDGLDVYSFPYEPFGSTLSHLAAYWRSRPLYKEADADVYHSIEAMIESYLAERMMPGRRHLIHFQDPYDEQAFREMQTVDTSYAWTAKKSMEFRLNTLLLRRACAQADAVVTQARCFQPILQRLFHVDEAEFLPNPVDVPPNPPKKASTPTVCFLGRWDPQKRVEKFLALAERFPDVEFVAMGRGHDAATDRRFRAKYGGQSNLTLPGFVSEIEKRRILARSWILINTSIREGLPVSFLEALAQKTAILSFVDPDHLASRFGCTVPDDGFEAGLRTLLADDRWRARGAAGYDHVAAVYETDTVISRYIDLYKRLIAEPS